MQPQKGKRKNSSGIALVKKLKIKRQKKKISVKAKLYENNIALKKEFNKIK